jgi:endogenous inhibitor of DNA gyrase (YacG/DUF329 family)
MFHEKVCFRRIWRASMMHCNHKEFHMTSKCPKCEKLVTRLNLNGMDASEPFKMGNGWKAITLTCPHCSSVLGAQIDPIAIRSDIVNAIKKG